MNVYITGTPEIPFTLIEDVCKELNAAKGVMKFIPTIQLKQKELSSLNNSFDHLDQMDAMSFDMFFSLCQINRTFHRIDEDDFIVVLSSIRNDLNWFSATKNKDIFIDTNDWDHYTGKNPVYGISYQVIENIFQSLIGIYYDNAEGHPNVHFENEGCINDFCEDKKSVTLKLRTADICDRCQKKAIESNIHWKDMHQIQGIMESIRNNVRSLRTVDKAELESIKINQKGEVIIGDRIIKMKKLSKTLYIIFLKQKNPISKVKLKGIKRDIIEIYEILKGKENEKTINGLIDPLGKSFRQCKWDVNKVLGKELNEAIVGDYLIEENEKQMYLVRIPYKYREVEL